MDLHAQPKGSDDTAKSGAASSPKNGGGGAGAVGGRGGNGGSGSDNGGTGAAWLGSAQKVPISTAGDGGAYTDVDAEAAAGASVITPAADGAVEQPPPEVVPSANPTEIVPTMGGSKGDNKRPSETGPTSLKAALASSTIIDGPTPPTVDPPEHPAVVQGVDGGDGSDNAGGEGGHGGGGGGGGVRGGNEDGNKRKPSAREHAPPSIARSELLRLLGQQGALKRRAMESDAVRPVLMDRDFTRVRLFSSEISYPQV